MFFVYILLKVIMSLDKFCLQIKHLRVYIKIYLNVMLLSVENISFLFRNKSALNG